ncbi:Retrovirus-related Pol polyprotein from transposon RE2-like protein [Drosera capensis]
MITTSAPALLSAVQQVPLVRVDTLVLHWRRFVARNHRGAIGDFVLWSGLVEIGLKSLRKGKYLTDEPPNPITADWSIENSLILMILWNAMEPDILSTVHTFKTTKKKNMESSPSYLFKKKKVQNNHLGRKKEKDLAVLLTLLITTCSAPTARNWGHMKWDYSKHLLGSPRPPCAQLATTDQSRNVNAFDARSSGKRKARPCSPATQDHEPCASPAPPQNSEPKQPAVLPPNPGPEPLPQPPLLPTMTFLLLSKKANATCYGVDYEKIFFPVAKMVYVCIFIAFYVIYRWPLHQFLEEEVYMTQPPGLVVQEHASKVRHLKRSLCGLKQYPQAWFEYLSQALS